MAALAHETALAGADSAEIAWGASAVFVLFAGGLFVWRYLGLARANRLLSAAAHEREAAAAALAESEARYREIIENSKLGIQVTNRNGERVFVNQACADLVGFSSCEELLAAQPRVFVAPHERERLSGYRQAKLRGEPAPDAYEFDAVRKDGTPLRLQAYHTRIQWEGEEAIQRTYVDLTDRKKAEDALRASEARLNNAQRIASVGDWHRDYASGQTVWSDETYRIFGVERDRQPSLGLFMSLVHPDDRSLLLATVHKALKTGEPYIFDHRIIRPDGTERIISEHGEITFGVDGKPSFVAGTSQDVTEIRRVQRGLAESEARFRSVIEAGGAGIVLCDSYGRCELANPEFSRFVGWAYEDLKGRTLWEFLDPADADAFRAGFDVLRKGGKSRFEIECRMVSNASERAWASINLTATRDTGDGSLRFIAIIQDITGRKHAEAELARKTEMLNLARDMATATNLAASFEQAVQSCLDRICAFTGWPIGHAYVRADSDRETLVSLGVMHIEDQDCRRQFAELSLGLTFGRSHAFVDRVIQRRDVQWQSGLPYDPASPGPRSPTLARMGFRLGVGTPVMAGDEIVAVLEFFAPERRERDTALCEVLLQVGTLLGRVYEREKAAEALRAREIQLSQIIDNVPYRIYIKDEEDRYLLVNRAVGETFRRPVEDIIGRTFGELYSDKHDLERFLEDDRKVIAFGQTVYVPEEKFVTVDGRVRYMRTIKTPYAFSEGRRAVLGISFDITEEKQHQEQLRRAQRMDALGRMTGGVAHDFNNLLTIILGNLQLLERNLNDESLKTMAATAEAAARRGAAMTRRLLAFARSQPLAPSTTVLNDLVSAVARIVPFSLGADVRVELRLSEDLWPTLVDPAEMENAILNLLLNSRDAMPRGGLIVVSTENVSLPERLADGQGQIEAGDYVMVAVSDTGTGMTEEVLARAVEPFFTTKEVGKGSGLGLSMAYGFAQQSGGGVFIDSAPKQGTTVRVYLPRSEYRPELLRSAASAVPSTGDQETILLVEDDPDVRAFTATALSNLNYRVVEAADAVEGLKMLGSGAKVDLLLTDVTLPGGVDGRALAREVRRRYSGLPVLFTSGNWEVSHPVGGEEWASNDAILQKPYTQRELGDIIQQVLEKPRRKGA